MAKRFVAGLDVGTTKVCMVVAEPLPSGSIHIVGTGIAPSAGLRKGMVVDVDATVRSIAEAVDRAERMAGAPIDQAVIGIAGGHVSASNSSGVIAISRPDHEIEPEDVQRVLEAARTIPIPSDREVIHVLPREYVVDGCPGIRDPVGMAGRRLEVHVHVVTGAVAAVQNVVKCAERAGIRVEDVVLQPLASGEAVLHPSEREVGVVLMDLGGGTTDIAVMHQGTVWHTAVLPVGGNHITNDLSYGLRTSVAHAEAVKLSCGCALLDMADPERRVPVEGGTFDGRQSVDQQTVASIVAPRVEEIFQMVRRELVASGMEEMVPAGVVLTGGTALLPGMEAAARRYLEMPARIGTPSGVGGLADLVNSPVYATAVGLVLYAARREKATEAAATADMTTGVASLWTRVREWFSGLF